MSGSTVVVVDVFVEPDDPDDPPLLISVPLQFADCKAQWLKN